MEIEAGRLLDALGAVADRLGVHKELAGRFLVVKVVLAQDRGGLKELKAAVVELAHARVDKARELGGVGYLHKELVDAQILKAHDAAVILLAVKEALDFGDLAHQVGQVRRRSKRRDSAQVRKRWQRRHHGDIFHNRLDISRIVAGLGRFDVMQKDDRIVHLQVGGLGIEHLEAATRHNQDIAATIDGIGVVEIDLEHQGFVMGEGTNAQRLQAVHDAFGVERRLGEQLAHHIVVLEEDLTIEGVLLKDFHL